MDGHTADPTPDPDPHSVLQQLLRQAQAGSTSLSPDSDQDDNRSGSDDGHIDTEGDGDRDNQAGPADSDTEHADPVPYERLSATLASIDADRRELALLVQQRRHLSSALKHNVTHQKSLDRSLSLLLQTKTELKSALDSLDAADILDAEDQSLEVIRTYTFAEDAAAICPFPTAMVQQIPLLRLQSIERAEYDNALGSRVWLEIEDQQLKAAVKASALNEYTVALSMDSKFHGDPLAEAAKLDEVAALRLAEEMEERVKTGAGAGIDWATVVGRLPSRTVQEARTRWNGVLKPSINSNPWSKDEIDELIRLATPHLTAYIAQQQAHAPPPDSSSASAGPSNHADYPVPWQRIAQQLGTNRTAHACLVAFCAAIVSRDQPDFSPNEDDAIRERFSLFRGAWRFIALHHSDSPNLCLDPSSSLRTATVLGKVGREPTHIYRRFRNTFDPALTLGKWSASEDTLLIDAVRALGDSQDNWAAISARVPGRTSSQCRERWNRRLKQIVGQAEETVDEQKLEQLRQGKSRLVWTEQMTEALMEYVDEDEENGLSKKEGKTFVGIAEEVGRRCGVLLSDKSVRDRIVGLQREREKKAKADRKQKGKERSNKAAISQAEQAKDHGESIESSTAADTPNTAPTPEPTLEPRARTAILPGAKRRKL